MNFNKCCRCGCFFINNNHVCPNCQSKEDNDISILKNYFNENGVPTSIENLSTQTGISLKNVNRLISQNDELSNIFKFDNKEKQL